MNVKEIIKEMTLDEKIKFVTGKGPFDTYDIERLDIPSVRMSDGPHGVRKIQRDKDKMPEGTTCFPTSSALSASFNTELAYKVGAAIGEECREMGIDIILGPGVNIKRTPLCGRNFEYFSEDPYVAGELGAAYINGVQSKGVGTSLKHYALNNQEHMRFLINSEVDERTMREVYLKPFEISVKKSQPWTVMCAYNKVNGMYCSENKFLNEDILKKEWGFEGIIVSDWGAVHHRAKALKGSLDLCMPFREKAEFEVREGLETGLITMEDLDKAVENMLSLVLRVKEKRQQKGGYNRKKAHETAKEAAREVITLLKNESNILPINKTKVKKLGIFGDFAREPVYQGGGSSRVTTLPEYVESPLECIKQLAGNDIEIIFEPLYERDNAVFSYDGRNTARRVAKEVDMAIVFIGQHYCNERENTDRNSLELPTLMNDMARNVSENCPNTVVVMQAGSAVTTELWGESAKGIIQMWYAGEGGGSAIAEVLFGIVNPSGKLAETFPRRLDDNAVHSSYPGNGLNLWYQEGVFVGYKYYDSYEKKVLYPFGHGLSYTTFEYSDLKVTPEKTEDSKTPVRVSFKLKNTGKMAGKEAVQLYIKDLKSTMIKPEKELRAFRKLHLEPGEEYIVEFNLEPEMFAYYSVHLKEWHVESGKYQIMIGASSRDIRLTADVFIEDKSDYTMYNKQGTMILE